MIDDDATMNGLPLITTDETSNTKCKRCFAFVSQKKWKRDDFGLKMLKIDNMITVTPNGEFQRLISYFVLKETLIISPANKSVEPVSRT